MWASKLVALATSDEAEDFLLHSLAHGSSGSPAFFIHRNHDSLLHLPCDDVPSLFHRFWGRFSEFSSPGALDTAIKVELDSALLNRFIIDLWEWRAELGEYFFKYL